MVIIPGVLIAVLTFPGVIVHELAHQLACRMMKVPVLEVKYFQFKNPCGYVIHDATDRPLANFVISAGPFLLNTVLGVAIVFPGMVIYHAFRSSSDPLVTVAMLVSLWLGVSILAHSFPSRGDAKAMVHTILKNKQVNVFAKILTAPVIGLIYAGSYGSVIWLEFGYAILVGSQLPRLVLSLI